MTYESGPGINVSSTSLRLPSSPTPPLILNEAGVDLLAFTGFPRTLATDLVQESPTTVEPGNPTPQGCRRIFPPNVPWSG
jgi:hypothetical protein